MPQGRGLTHPGDDRCFVNSTLHAVVYTPSLADPLLQGGAAGLHNGKVSGGCYLCVGRRLASQ